METITLNLPTLYGDHKTVEVRGILIALPGVTQVFASAALQQVAVTFDPGQVNSEAIIATLSNAGYTPGEAPASLAPPMPADDLRHVTAADQARAVRESKYPPAQALGSCPGLEPQVAAGEHPADRA